jgi:hypothetical protein
MSITAVFQSVLGKMTLIGGHASVLNERCIVLSWNHMSGLVVLSPEGHYTVKVSTAWKDEDTAIVHRVEDIPDKVADLFQNFWARRGVKFNTQASGPENETGNS